MNNIILPSSTKLNSTKLSAIKFSAPRLNSTDSLSHYITFVNSIPLLTDIEEKTLLSNFHNGDQSAGKKVAEAHLRVVVRIAMQFQKHYANIWDIISEGNIGLLKALKGFSAEKNVKFVTYANLWIKASIQEFILKSSSMLKISLGTAQKKILFNLGKVKAQLRKIHGENGATTKRISKILSVEESEIINISTALNSSENSLDVTVGDDYENPQTVMDITPSCVKNPEENFADKETVNAQKAIIAKGFAKLNEREKTIITKRFLVKRTLTLLELANEFKLSVERIRQIEAEALRKMRKVV